MLPASCCFPGKSDVRWPNCPQSAMTIDIRHRMTRWLMTLGAKCKGFLAFYYLHCITDYRLQITVLIIVLFVVCSVPGILCLFFKIPVSRKWTNHNCRRDSPVYRQTPPHLFVVRWPLAVGSSFTMIKVKPKPTCIPNPNSQPRPKNFPITQQEIDISLFNRSLVFFSFRSQIDRNRNRDGMTE